MGGGVVDQNPNWPSVAVAVAFNRGLKGSTVPVWTNLSSDVWSFSCDRGRQYELDQVQAGLGSVVIGDKFEWLNPANPRSPHWPNVKPYRPLLIQAMWPPDGIGNLLNGAVADPGGGGFYDPSFESYAVGDTVPWITPVGGVTPAVSNTVAHDGTQSLQFDVLGTSTVQGLAWYVPCLPGETYTSSAWFRTNSGFETIWLSVDGTGGWGSSMISPPSGTPMLPKRSWAEGISGGSWIRLHVTFTATQPAHVIQIGTVPASAYAATVNIDGVQHEVGTSVSAFTVSGPAIHGIHRGFVERWPRKWNHRGMYGYTEITTVDAFAALAAKTLSTELRSAVTATQPKCFWPLNDADGSAEVPTFNEISGTADLALSLTYAGNGPGNSTMNFQSEIPLPGDPGGSGVQFTADTTINESTTAGRMLANYQLGVSTAAVTFGLWFAGPKVGPAYPANPGDGWDTLDDITLMQLDSPNAHVALHYGTSTYYGTNGLSLQYGYTAYFVGTSTPFDYQNTGPVFLVGTMANDAFGNVTLDLFVNGVLAAHNTTADGIVETIGQVTVAGIVGTCAAPGTYTNAAVWDRVLTSAEIAALYQAGAGFPGETSGERVARYLSYGYDGITAVDAGLSTMGVSDLAGGTTLLDACLGVTTSEGGNLWADGFGTLTFAQRDRRHQATVPQWVIGEHDLAYLEDVAYDNDATLTFNDVTVTQSGGVVVRVADQGVGSSDEEFGPRTYQVTVNVADADEVRDRAAWILLTHKDPQSRIATLTLRPSHDPSLWPVALGVEIGTRVTVYHTATTAGVVTTGDFFVEQISHDVKPDEWTVSLQMSPVSAVRPFVLDDTAFGLLDADNALVY